MPFDQLGRLQKGAAERLVHTVALVSLIRLALLERPGAQQLTSVELDELFEDLRMCAAVFKEAYRGKAEE